MFLFKLLPTSFIFKNSLELAPSLYLLAENNKGLLLVEVLLPGEPCVRRVHFKAMKQPCDRAQIPEDQACSLWVSLKLTLSLTIPSTPIGRELFQPVLQAGIGTSGPPPISREPPVPSYPHPSDCSLVVCSESFLCSFRFFMSVNLFMMTSYCLLWKLLTFASDRALSSELHI